MDDSNKIGVGAEEKFIASKEAAALCGYTIDHISRLCRTGKVHAKRIGRDWFVLEESLAAFRKNIAAALPIQETEVVHQESVAAHLFDEPVTAVPLADSWNAALLLEQQRTITARKKPEVAIAQISKNNFSTYCGIALSMVGVIATLVFVFTKAPPIRHPSTDGGNSEFSLHPFSAQIPTVSEVSDRVELFFSVVAGGFHDIVGMFWNG